MKHRNFKRRLMKLAEVERDRNGARSDWDNHTLPVIVTELKTPERPCELGCGKMVKDQVLNHWNPTGECWITKCKTCALWQDPETKELKDHQAFRDVFRRFRIPFSHRN